MEGMDDVTLPSDPTHGIVRRVEALRYRGLRYVAQEVGPFAVLVGPNGAGKSSFLDCIALVSDYLRATMSRALVGVDGRPGRARRVGELVHQRHGVSFEIALDLTIP